jgi:hypothetical protein
MQTKRGVALSDCRCAQARTRFTPLQRFAKAKLCLSIKAFHAVRIFARLHGGDRIAQRVGWVERSEAHHATRRPIDGFRKGTRSPAAKQAIASDTNSSTKCAESAPIGGPYTNDIDGQRDACPGCTAVS